MDRCSEEETQKDRWGWGETGGQDVSQLPDTGLPTGRNLNLGEAPAAVEGSRAGPSCAGRSSCAVQAEG